MNNVDGPHGAEPVELRQQRVGPADLAEFGGAPLSAADCVFTGCDLSVMHFGVVKGCQFVDSKLRGTVFSKHIMATTFNQCALNECRFRMTVLRDVMFEHCHLLDNDFYGSELERVAFPDSEFAGVGFDACQLAEVDLSEASSLLVGDPRTLIGATIDETQVPAIGLRLATLSGINVLER